MNKAFDAVLYDMDGLIIDSEPLWRRAETICFNAVGVPLTEELCHETMGKRIDDVVNYWHERFPWSVEQFPKKQMEEKIVASLIELIGKEGLPMAGLFECLKFFESQKIPCAIASSSSMQIIQAVVDKFKLGKNFKHLVSAEHMTFGKPHPEVYLTAAAKLNAEPTRCLVLEDSVTGLIAAKAARMQCFVVPEKGKQKDARFSIADRVLDSLNDLPELLATNS